MKVNLSKRMVRDILRMQGEEIEGLELTIEYQAATIEKLKSDIADLVAENWSLMSDQDF